MTDLHSHILPHIDDGAANTAQTHELLTEEKRQGVNKIMFTPHFYPEKIEMDRFLTFRNAAYADILSRGIIPGEIKTALGAEVHFSPALVNMDAWRLTLGDTGYLLLELSSRQKPVFLKQVISSLDNKGIVSIIAHVERYPYVLSNPIVLYEWADMGCILQVDADSLFMDHKLTDFILKCIKWNLVHVIASDAHSMEKRPPRLKDAYRLISNKLGREYAKRLAANADNIFAGLQIEYTEPHMPRKFLGKWI